MEPDEQVDCLLCRVETCVEPRRLVTRICGELDIATAHRVRGACVPDVDGIETVVLDLADLTFCDVAGLHALLALRDAHLARGRHVVTVNPTRAVRRLLQVTGTEDLLQACP